MKRKVRTAERTHSEGEKIKSFEVVIALVLRKMTIEKLKKTANKLNILNRTSQPHSHCSPFVWQIVSINSFGHARAGAKNKVTKVFSST